MGVDHAPKTRNVQSTYVHALRVLEFPRVLERVAARAESDLGRERVAALRPSSDRDEVAHELRRVAAVLSFLERRPEWSLGPCPDVRGALAALTVEGALLDAAALHRVGVVLTTSRLLEAELTLAGPGLDALESTVGRLFNAPEIEAAIGRSVDAEGNVLSSASRELKKIRDGLRGAHARVVRALEAFQAGLPDRVLVPDASVTIRDGRYVVPIRREGRGEVGGIVHGESQTGATLYVEPPVAIELMNRLRDLEGEEAREIRRILGMLTESLTPLARLLSEASDALADFDGLSARARTAREWGATVPDVAEEPGAGLRIRTGRHPLLVEAGDGEVVPFDLELTPRERVVVISGPNTGGKSVLLKATGLFSVLAQSGVVPPLGPGSLLPVFGSVFADIGDEQSIAHNLSTFSAHLANLSDILDRCDHESLVLIDEMGTGTDPGEGAALARAVLEELVERGATTFVTSHLGELKRLDQEGSGIVNASLEFDSERMTPTYRLAKGRPGRSYGLAIARRLGFPAAVLDRAEHLREEGSAELEELLERLERDEREARELSRQMTLERDRAARALAEVGERERVVWEAERTADKRAREDARRMLLEARREVDEVIRDLRDAASAGRHLDVAAKEARRRVESAASRLRGHDSVAARRGESVTLAPGDPVRIASTGSRGRVLEVRDDRAWIEAGALRLEVPLSDLEELPLGDPTQTPPARTTGVWRAPHTEDVRMEVDLRGMRVDEFEAELTKALDEAVLADLGELRIIHGKGTGALRERAGELLEADDRVVAHRMGGPQEGGAGVTIASFRG